MSRFGQLDEGEVDQLIDDKDAKNTKATVRQCVTAFRDFLAAKGESVDFEEFEPSKLNKFLALFWPNARRKDGVKYKTKTMQKLKFGLKKHLLAKKDINIDKGLEFNRSATSFLAALTDLKKCGKGTVVHKDIISDEDLKLLYSGKTPVFDQGTPCGLIHKVWFDILWYFMRRGQENQRDMDDSHFTLQRDPSGAEYVKQEVDELDKNHRQYSSEEKQSRMYAKPGRHIFDFEI